MGNLLETLTDFLKNRNQRVVLNGQNSSWVNIEAGVPQGSILGPLLFVIYINDLPDNLSTNVKLFAGDTSLFSVVDDIATSCDLNYDLNRVREWAFPWKIQLKYLMAIIIIIIIENSSLSTLGVVSHVSANAWFCYYVCYYFVAL